MFGSLRREELCWDAGREEEEGKLGVLLLGRGGTIWRPGWKVLVGMGRSGASRVETSKLSGSESSISSIRACRDIIVEVR